MAYRRFVTYLFRYQNGKKEKNCGFAKVEVRQERARMEIQVRGVPDGTDRVYLFALRDIGDKKDLEIADETEQKAAVKPGVQLVGAYIGNLTVRDGVGREWFAFNADAIGETPYGMEEMTGIYIQSAGGFLASQWVDEELDWDGFREYEPPKEERAAQAENPVQDGNAKQQNPAAQEESLKQEKNPALQANPSEQDTAAATQGQSVARKDSVLPETGKPDAEEAKEDSANMLQKNPAELHATQAATAAVRAEIPQRETRISSYINTWERQWRTFTESHPLFCPFDEAPEILAVKMDLRDFKRLPKNYLPLANNSFLLHGYFNYKYLLFGYIDGEPRRWFLGIPGVFQNQEQLLAGLFGFGEFRTKHTTKQKTGEFGYWYRYLEL